MLISEDMLFRYGGELLRFSKNDFIFREAETPKFYYQIIRGEVKLNNYQQDGKEFIHSLPTVGHCIGETFLFSDSPYPVNAEVMTDDSEVMRLTRSKFFELLGQDPQIFRKLYHYTAERMYYRYVMMNLITASDPVHKVKGLMDCLKNYHKKTGLYSYQIPYTRKEMASLTNLRVETVIRIIKNMEKDQLLQIRNRKIFY
ncbi:Crp/Fnr family transcriptional regulator [Chryseobacterium wangxinyae]|uniref:Crp/Fnr family transcriptional regulator n=2 Tax=unclassified Chryseobacterium TaxID=2593645 RepID=UPI0022715A29|nr:Crp/Fnr family transcriptional regulator [Chryseobacterium sp. CY350]WBZ96510.1 Crp/Fnr family transcriptional regulator [Chryseobacterium sp. CY350]